MWACRQSGVRVFFVAREFGRAYSGPRGRYADWMWSRGNVTAKIFANALQLVLVCGTVWQGTILLYSVLFRKGFSVNCLFFLIRQDGAVRDVVLGVAPVPEHMIFGSLACWFSDQPAAVA